MGRGSLNHGTTAVFCPGDAGTGPIFCLPHPPSALFPFGRPQKQIHSPEVEELRMFERSSMF